MAQAALINFFGEAGTVSSIMNTVQPSHTQTSTEHSDNSQLNILKNQQGMSLPVSTHSYTIPHLTHSRQPQTLTLQCNKTARDKVTEYHNITLIIILILIEEE